MKRILEKEVMDSPVQAAAYANVDFFESNSAIVSRINARIDNEEISTILNIGCGPCDLDILLAQALPDVHITAIDASEPMLRIAQERISDAGLTKRISLRKEYLPGLYLNNQTYDVVISKDTLHHLPEPMVLWNEVKRLGHSGTHVYVADLFRPASVQNVKDIVHSVVGVNADKIVLDDFYNSLCAAFRPQEVREQLEEVGLSLTVEQISERHMVIYGRL